MDFAKKILSKYGWKDGDGLGKNNNGISKPIRANLKFDNAGLGLDRAKEFNDHWWERCFNEAASNVDITNGNGNVAVALKNSDDSVEISTKGYSQKKLKKAKEQSAAAGGAVYDNFLQCSTLTRSGDEVLNDKRISVKEIEVVEVKVLTDEELFLACGGRTAHKGARHGLKLSAKLARLEEQERQMLAKMQEKDASKVLEKCAADEVELEIPKKKKKKKSRENDISETRDEQCHDYVVTEEEKNVIKKKKKKDKRKTVDTEEINDAASSDANERSAKKKRKMEKSKIDEFDSELQDQVSTEINEPTSEEVEPSQTIDKPKETSTTEETIFETSKTKKKKKKHNK